jgi:hypothetical protein
MRSRIIESEQYLLQWRALLILNRITELLGKGYGDRDLLHICTKCGSEIDHDFLRVAKFRRDTEKLITHDWPLGGTILSPSTGTILAPLMMHRHIDSNTFPNRLIGIELRIRVLDLISPSSRSRRTMNDVKDLVEHAIRDRSLVKRVHGKSSVDTGILTRDERLAVRKMMSRYWENDSIFALELGGAVIRQGVFVDKMHDLDWLHSPTAKATMTRLLNKYTRFIQIMATYPLHVAVPTLDVDLAWHTHQLSPKQYFNYTVEKCKKFIDHDDKMDENALSSSFEWTSKTYEKMFQEVYSECTCWYCECEFSHAYLPKAALTNHSHSIKIYIQHRPYFQTIQA